ncbi:MAG: ThiF family adenylyltransferase [Luteibacter sp.]|uniref:ThiF family adenylyltransferase n=1 Tax=Luteibacter sp. TaxID=1886636 RepID=UPI0028074E6C|nr:ThiF family adenylyltransferase [Luteibacter sp.]MDQ7995275.1 ThiF family adenylyltransferase [Luteibacter sp.]
MTEIVVGEILWDRILALAAAPVEAGAALFLSPDRATDRWLAHDLTEAAGSDCLCATATAFTYAPQFLSRVTRMARQGGYALALFHSHPSGFPDFSDTDDDTEQRLMPFMRVRLPEQPTLSLLMCDGQLRARRLGTQDLIPVRRVGAVVHRSSLHAPEPVADGAFDRQVRAFGAEGQATLAAMKVAIVGLGGTGSLVAQQLAHLGVGQLSLIDQDTIDETSLNRVVGATAVSVGQPKVSVARSMISAIRPAAAVRSLHASVRSEQALHLLVDADCIMVCTDSHVSRAFVNDVAYQYLVPAIDMGVAIGTDAGRVVSITGRTQMLAPGLPCLWCTNAISANTIRQELQSDAERAADRYFDGDGVRQPAVISLNSTAASLAVSMLLGAFTGIPIGPRFQSYDALRGTVRAFAFKARSDCGICGAEGLTALGDRQPLALVEKASP